MKKFNVYVETPKQMAAKYTGNFCDPTEGNLVAYIFDDDEGFLPDYTDDWLNDILFDSPGYCSETMESVFEIDKDTLDYLVNHPQCNEVRYCTYNEACGEGDDGWEIEEDELEGEPIKQGTQAAPKSVRSSRWDEEDDDEDDENEPAPSAAPKNAEREAANNRLNDNILKICKEKGYSDEQIKRLFPHLFR